MAEVLVVSPIRAHREALSAALEKGTSLAVVGEAATLGEALPRLRDRQRPRVALLVGPPLEDLALAGPLPTDPEPKIVAVGVPEYEAVAWIEAGASRVVSPDSSLEEVVVAVENVIDLVTEPPDFISEARLTARETEILNLIGAGLTNKQIAERLSIQVQTVKNHVHSVRVKLGAGGRAEAVSRIRRRRRQ